MELSEIREKIDEIDKKLLPLFLERMSLSMEAARYKAENGMQILDKSREDEILKRVCAYSGDMGEYARRLYQTIFELSRDCQSSFL